MARPAAILKARGGGSGLRGFLNGVLMKTFYRIVSVITLSALISASALAAFAQDQDDRQYDPERDIQSSQADPPARAARLQYLSGSVSVQPHGADDWIAGGVNRPLTNSDNIWADKDSRAEISVGTGLIRIGAESSLTLTNVDANTIQLQLHQGAMNLHVRRLYDGETYEVDTSNQAFTIAQPGDYRFDVDPNADSTVVTVWRGEGEATGDGPAVRLRANVQARFSNGTSLQHDIHSVHSPDSFDDWARLRDQRLDHSTSARYVSADVVGSEDLDEYGTWRDTRSYGHVWVPSRVDVGWSPYRHGHWIWVDPWGWTWDEDEPWGYAPFHYGRWVYNDNYWGWAPGPIYERPYYSPALVAWFGGGGWGASFGFGYGGGYGWCPLGYGEPYIPWYGVSRGYFNRVNVTNTRITNITNITNIYNNTYINNQTGKQGHPGNPGYPPTTGGGGYGPHNGNAIRYANMRVPNGFTAVSRNTLVNSQPVARNAVRIAPNQLSRVAAVSAVDARPTRTTMLGGNTGRTAAMPPSQTFARPVVSHVAPPAGNRGSFHSASPVASARRNSGPTQQMGNAQPGNAQPGNGRGIQRPAENMPNRAASQGSGRNSIPNASPNVSPNAIPNSGNKARMADRGPAASRPVPRPPSAGGFDNRGGMNQGGVRSGPANNPGMNTRPETSRPSMGRPSSPETGARGNVPQPPSGSMGRGPSPSANQSSGMTNRPSNIDRSSSVPRNAEPSRGNAPMPRSSEPPRSSAPAQHSPAPRSDDRPGPPRSQASVPRPMGNTAQSPRGYSSAAERGSYPSESRSYGGGRPSPSYDRGSSGRPSPSYGGGSYSRPAPAPSRDRGSYSRQAPSYGGGSYGRSAPAPSYGGGSGRPAPSYGGDGRESSYGGGGYGGGGRAPSYGGGSGRSTPSYGGGGGRAPSYGGGGVGHPSAPSHSSGGGGGGGSHNNGGPHNGRH